MKTPKDRTAQDQKTATIVFHYGIRQTADGRWAGARAGGTSCTSTGGTKLKAGLVQRQMPKMSNMAPKVADHDHDPPDLPSASLPSSIVTSYTRSTSHTHTPVTECNGSTLLRPCDKSHEKEKNAFCKCVYVCVCVQRVRNRS